MPTQKPLVTVMVAVQDEGWPLPIEMVAVLCGFIVCFNQKLHVQVILGQNLPLEWIVSHCTFQI